MNKAEVDALELSIKREYEEKLSAIRLVQQMLSKGGNRPQMGTSPIESMPVVMPPDDDGVDESLVRNIERIFLADLSAGWTIPKLEKKLMALGVPLRAKNPKPSIAGAVKRLLKRNVVRLTKRGAGKIPNIYKGIEQKLTGNET